MGRIGFSPEMDTELAKLDTDLRTSRSGLYWEDAHPMVMLENIQMIASNQDKSVFPEFSAGAFYPIDAIVKDVDGVVYRKISDAPEGTLLEDPTAWTETSALGIWLRGKVKAAIKRVVSDMYTRKKKAQTVKSILEDAYLFDGAGNLNDKEVKENRFVGYQIVFKGAQGLTMLIDQISTQFTGAFPDEGLALYLYYTGSDEPVAEINLQPNRTNTVQWHKDLSIFNINYEGGTSGVGGAWFLGYYEEDVPLGVQAINRSNFNFQKGPCGSCGTNSFDVWRRWFQWVSIIPIAVPVSNLQPSRFIWDWTMNQYYYESKTWGLNLHFSMGCNTSAVICRQQATFDQALLLQFAVDILGEIGFSTRINRTYEKLQQKALFELDDRETNRQSNKGQKGLKSQLSDAIDALDFDFSSLNSVCIPCDQRTGITASAI